MKTYPADALRGMVGQPFWHIHHESLMEFATEPIENRVAYIRSDKLAEEVPIRLRWLEPVKGPLPVGLVKAWAASKAWAAAMPALLALHASEHPDCPWTAEKGLL